MSNAQSFIRLSKVHAWLDELFRAHQIALLSLELREAGRCLDLYDANLSLHLSDEEHLLIPIYSARTSDVPGGAVELFTGEHKKIRRFVAEFHGALQRLRSQRKVELKRAIIDLLDRETMYKGLLAHHHAREYNILFPWLDWLTSEAERAKLLAQCASLSAYQSTLRKMPVR